MSALIYQACLEACSDLRAEVLTPKGIRMIHDNIIYSQSQHRNQWLELVLIKCPALK